MIYEMTHPPGSGSQAGSAVGLRDAADEAAVKTAERPNYGMLGFTLAEGVLFGIPQGCIAFHDVLVTNGAFSALCPGEAMQCVAQQAAIAQFTQLIVVLAAVGSLIIEPLVGLLGPNNSARFLIVLGGTGLAICGIDLRTGVAYVVGMATMCIAFSAMFNLNVGTFFGAATPGASPEVVNFWMTNLSVSVDIGFFLAAATAGIAAWSVLTLKWWFITLGVMLAVGLLIWFESVIRSADRRRRLVEEQQPASGRDGDHSDDVAANRRTSPPPPRSFRSLLGDRGFLIATAQFAWSLIVFSSIEAAAARIARYFDLTPDASFYTPVAVSVGGLAILCWAHTRWNDVPWASGTLRIGLAGLVGLVFGVPMFRCPATYFIGFGLGGAWRATSMAVSINNVYFAGGEGSETRAFSFMIVMSMVLALGLGQMVTALAGESPLALSLVMAVTPLGAFAWEVLSPPTNALPAASGP